MDYDSTTVKITQNKSITIISDREPSLQAIAEGKRGKRKFLLSSTNVIIELMYALRQRLKAQFFGCHVFAALRLTFAR